MCSALCAGAGTGQGGFDDGAFALQLGAAGALGQLGQAGQFFFGLGLQAPGVFVGFALAAGADEGVALARVLRLGGRPGGPAGAAAGHVFQRDAVHGAGGHAQFAAGALVFNDGVHALVAAHDAVDRAGFDAQGAADAPGFVDPGHVARAFGAVFGVEGLRGLAGEGGQALNTLLTAGRALVDGGLAAGDGLGVGGAVGVAAALALGLGQGVQQLAGQRAGWLRLLRGQGRTGVGQGAGAGARRLAAAAGSA